VGGRKNKHPSFIKASFCVLGYNYHGSVRGGGDTLFKI
jgi:hypothetical protein